MRLLEGVAIAAAAAFCVRSIGVSLRSSERIEPREPDRALPMLSIIVPARNEERQIEECVRSLLAQRYPHFELIAVNDRSDDGTGAILARLASAQSSPGNGDYNAVGGSVYVAFANSGGATSAVARSTATMRGTMAASTAGGVTITMPTPAGGLDPSTLADVHVTYANGTKMEIGAIPQASASGVTITLPSTITVFNPILNFEAVLDVLPPGARGQPNPGLVYYTRGSGW